MTRALSLALAALLAVAVPARAQGQSAPTPPSATDAGAVTPVTRSVAVEASGGPANLLDAVRAAIQAWAKAAPKLVDLHVDPAATSRIAYAPPALLGPDTLSLDLRTPGRQGITVQVAAGAVDSHPMVLLHEIGVLLGLPEGSGDAMAFAIPSSGEPAAPSAGDVQVLQAQRTFAPEDLNRDGTVDFYDLALFGQAFGTQGVNLPADFNHDGRVDGRDLALLEKAYHFSPPSQTAPAAALPAPAGNGSGSSTGAGKDSAAPSGGSSGP